MRSHSELLFTDVESGGLDPLKEDILSIGLVKWRDGDLLTRIEIPVYGTRVSEQAMAINHIDLKEHNKTALQPAEAARQVLNFVEYNFEKKPVVVAGHNVSFDIQFLKVLFNATGVDHRQHLSYRCVDTATLIRFASIAGLIGKDIGSLDEALNYFGITVTKRHTAQADAEYSAMVFNAILDLVTGKTKKKSRLFFWR